VLAILWSRMFIRWSVYSLATVMDVVLSSLIFVCTVRAVQMTGSSEASGRVLAVWAGMYLISSLGAGHVVTRRNVGWLLGGSCILAGVLSLAYINWPGLGAIYLITALQGLATAFFFVPFQLFMKLVDEGQNKGPARSSGLYVASWSLGYALGPFIAGFLWKHGWQICHWFNVVSLALMAVAVYLLKHHAEANPVQYSGCARDAVGPDAAVPVGTPPVLAYAHDPPPPSTGLPNLAWMAWVFSGLGCMMTSMIRTHFPVTGGRFALPELSQGITLCLMSGVQGLIGFLLGFSRRWMYRPGPILGFGLLGVVGLSLFAAGHGVNVFWPAAMCMGVYAGSIYFYFIYHALVHPTRSARYISINEVSVGIAGMAGPALGGMLADRFGLAVPYVAGAAMLTVGILVQAWVHHGYNRRAAASLPAAGDYDTAHERDQNQARVDCGI
jgi:MFS transporter, ACDE family, multidrug resistance protein